MISKFFQKLINQYCECRVGGKNSIFTPRPPSPVLYTKSRVGCEVSTLSICISVSSRVPPPDLPGHSNANCSTETSDGGHTEHYLPLTTSNME